MRRLASWNGLRECDNAAALHHGAHDQIKPERQQAQQEAEPEGGRVQAQPQDLA